MILDLPTTCGIIHFNQNKFLICHATLSPTWSIPKGIQEYDETYEEAASREMYEETGVWIDPDILTFKGVFPYTKQKNLALFIFYDNIFFNTAKMDCESMFFSKGFKKYFKEVDSYKYVTVEESEKLLNLKQYNIIKKVLRTDYNL